MGWPEEVGFALLDEWSRMRLLLTLSAKESNDPGHRELLRSKEKPDVRLTVNVPVKSKVRLQAELVVQVRSNKAFIVASSEKPIV
jgi:hypothetical protein